MHFFEEKKNPANFRIAPGPIIHFPRKRSPKKFATCLPEEKEDTKQSIRDGPGRTLKGAKKERESDTLRGITASCNS